MIRALGSIVSRIFSRWMILAAIAAVIAWNVHLRVDHLGGPVHAATITASTTAASSLGTR
jgi:hypothetical protein